MRKAITGLIVLIILVVGGILIFHKSPSYTNNNSASNNKSPSKTNSASVNNAVVLTKTSFSLGQYLTDPAGRPLYTYNGDTSGVSNCTGSCLTNWPIYQDKGATTNLPSGIGTIKRSDSGQMQFTYNGMPLYYFTGDTGSQVTGNGVDNFSIATPSAASQNSNNSSNSTPSNSSSSGYPY